SLFSSAESAFLLAAPVRDDRVFAYKFQGAVAFSSWAFLLLGSPILLAYGLVYGAAWYFYVLVPLFFLGFVLVPGALGAIICLLVVNFIPKRRKQVLLAAVLVLGALGAAWLYGVVSAAKTSVWSRDAVQQLVGHFTFSQGALVPSHWMAQGLQAAV